MKHPKITILETGGVGVLGVMYRIEATRYGSVDDWGDAIRGGGYSKLYAHEYAVLKVTKCGKWIRDRAGDRRFILDTSRKRFAHETLELALESFRARRLRQIGILQARLRTAEEELALATDDPDMPNLFHMSHTQLAQAAGALA